MVGVPLNMAQAAFKVAFKLKNSTDKYHHIALDSKDGLTTYYKDGERIDTIDLGLISQATLELWLLPIRWTFAARWSLAKGMGII